MLRVHKLNTELQDRPNFSGRFFGGGGLEKRVIGRMLTKKSGFDAEMDRFNKLMDAEFLGIRDFLILHYNATRRDDTEFWNYLRTLTIPESLEHKLELYRSSFRLYRDNNELFSEASWLAVMHGQSVVSGGYNPLVDTMKAAQLKQNLAEIRQVINRSLEVMPTHEAFIAEHCASVEL